jgi:amino acid adenylation domain-containing protein
MSLAKISEPRRSATSFAQDRLWYLSQASTASNLYNIPLALEVTGPLDRTAMEWAFFDVVARHEILRTTLSHAGEEINQLIHCALPGSVGIEQRRIAASDIDAEIANVVCYVFDLENEFPIRATLLEVETQRHILILLMHHIAGDGWSFEPLLRDLWAAYAARIRGAQPAWTPLPVQYCDYALWQKQVLGNESDPESVAAEQLAYWTEELKGLPEQLDLPADKPRPKVAGHRGGKIRYTLGAPQHKALIGIARRANGSLFMVLQTALAALLARLGAGDDIPLGSPIAGRSDEMLNDLIGLFLNILVLRVDTSGNPRFSELVDRVVDKCLAGFENSDVPFDRVVEAVNPVRSSARHPLFQVMLVLQNNAKASFDCPGATVRLREASTETSKFDLTFYFHEDTNDDGTPAGMQGHLEYATELFDTDTAVAIVERYFRVIDAVCADPKMRIGEIELLGAEERQKMLVDWNDTARPVPHGTTAVLFERQVAIVPDKPAIFFRDLSFSYAEINARANQLAHALIARGIGPEDIVGICQHRSPDLIVSLLGIFKAGAAYLPLDPDYPAERLEFMLRDAGPRLVLTLEESVGALPADTVKLVLDRFETQSSIAAEPTHNPDDSDRIYPLHPQSPAYLIYTSGSTGTPKGALGTHLCLLNRISWGHRTGASNSSLMKTSISFIDSFWEIFSSLVAGQPILLTKRFEDLFECGQSDVVPDTLNLRTAFVPSVLHKLARSLEFEHSMLRKVCFWNLGGEKLHRHQANAIKLVFPGIPVINTYGASEFWDAAFFDLSDDDPYEDVPIGRPIDNVEIYVLDQFLNPCPPSVPGMLFVAGNGLARGYHGRAALTAANFLPNTIKSDGSRMYRTGDVGRWRPNGTLEYLGRSDDQVKIRGVRIEIGEIEATLLQHASVKDAAVMARPDANGDYQLVAYVVANDGRAPCSEDIGGFVSSRLPSSMWPAHFVELDAMPQTESGKLDRKGLPAPDLSVPATTRINPRNMLETVVAEIFSEVLGRGDVGVTENFFELGGHSLLALTILAEIRRRTGADLALTTFYERPTVEYAASKVHDLITEHQGAI